jgi:hypothetical protein
MEEKTKKKIKNIVAAYKELFPKEYQAVVDYNKKMRIGSKKWAETGGEMGRINYNVATKLHMALTLKLDPAEYEQFISEKGNKWFVRTYPDFVPHNEKE